MVEYEPSGVPIGCPKCGLLKGTTAGCCKVEEPVEEALVEEVAEEVEEVEELEEEEDFEAYLEELPVKELKKLCKKADLDTKGKKADLIARLIE